MNRWKIRAHVWSASALAAVLVLALGSSLLAQVRVTTPKEHFGFNIGDDYHLATYTQFQSYWAKLDAESDRMVVQEIGKTAEGRPQLMAIITAPENHRNLARYKEISRRLALAEGLTDEQARELAREGKAVVWFDGGLHATEVLGAHQLIETVYRLVSSTDPEVMRFLNDLIILAVHANPDGMELVSNWYMREPDPTKRSTSGIPRLYHKYIGHDNNRDFYMVAMPETENMTRVMFHEWFPQIVYNHHQTGPAGAVLFAPPFRDPFNYFYDPLVPIGIEAVGAAMHQRFIAEGKPGATMRSGASYSTWWNGGLRTTTYFHNMIGLLTETIGNPTPVEIPFIPEMLLPRNDLPFPITPQKWHFRQSIEYSVTANYAVFDYASKHREELLYNIYRMGKNSIERGSRDHWTITPKRIAMVEEAARQAGVSGQQARGRRALPDSLFALLRRPELRDPRGYILPSDQPDFPTAVKFVNALIKNGITVQRATQAFTVNGKRYPAGSLVIKTAQAFRPHILDMFEPQDHPNDFRYPGGPPIPPYDNAGWTLAYQMGVQFDRILDGFDGPFEKIEGLAKVPAGNVANADRAAGFLLSHQVNDAFIATNRLLKAGHEVYWLTEPHRANGKTYPAGTIYIPARSGVLPILREAASQLGLNFEGTATAPSGELLKMKQVRIGLWDRYGGSMPSGWTRWLLEQFEFPFEVVYPQALDAGNLARRFDVLIFPTGAIPGWEESGGGFGGFGNQIDPQRIPQEYRSWLGSVTEERTVPQLIRFLNDGGTIIAIGSSVAMGKHAGLPIANHLVDASGRPLPEEEFYVPGSILRVRVDNTRPIAYGMPEQVDVFFDNSPVMKLLPEASARGVRRVAWFDTAEPLRSGWAWGQENLKDGVAAVEAQVGRGKLFLFGPEILNRGQPHGTFKFFFNGIYLGGASGARTPAVGGGR
ncbi:MAG: peptidase [Gemmatimonadales bacterium]|nr:MAG: peptidase [Gemmatimonadales bacterium]